MSQMPATTALRAPRRPAPARPELRVVPTAAPVKAPPRTLPFALFCSVILTLGLLALLFINMSLAQGAYELHDLQKRVVALDEEEQQLREELATLESPSHLAEEARKIGMVPGTVPVFLDVSDRSLTGKPVPAPGPTDVPGSGAGTAGGN